MFFASALKHNVHLCRLSYCGGSFSVFSVLPHVLCNFLNQVMLGVDRLDMIKGIPQKLLAFEMFLEKNPEWREKVMLVQIAVPTRTDVHECKFLTSIKYICKFFCF